MKNLIKAFILITIITVVSFLMPGLMDNTEYLTEAGEAEFSEEESGGEAPADFMVLEILPYHGMGEVGYLVDGQEPIDETLMNYDTAGGAVSFLGDAMDVYRSYTEKALPASGTADTGWRLARTYEYQNGYFEYVAYDGTGRYTLNAGTNYIRTADGAGNYKAVLGTMETVYNDAWEPTNQKNVKAYFVYGKPAGVTLYSSTDAYTVYSVQESADHTGDYDYDIKTETFYLNLGHGRYDVIFIPSKDKNNVYYMRNNYEIVDYGLGDYSFTVSYVAQAGGNYIINPANQYFTYNRWSGTYRFVKDEAALTKPNFSTDASGKIWVQKQPIIKEYEFTYKVKLVNNEWFKTQTLGISPDQAQNYTVDVVTLTPAELNLPENQHYIDEADMFYLNTQIHNGNYLMLYETYNSEGKAIPPAEKFYGNNARQTAYLNYAVNDISWDNAVRLFKNIAGIGCNKAAIVVDTTFFINAIQGKDAYASLAKSISVSYSYNNNNATMCNMAKLYIMIYQRNMIDFYNSFLNPATTSYLVTQVNTTVNASGATGSFIRPDSTKPANAMADAAIYWNGNTFLPYGLNSAGVMTRFLQEELYSQGIVNFNILATPYDLTDNILSIGGSGIFTSNFQDSINLPKDSEDEAVEHLSSLNEDGSIVSTGGISIGDLVNVISNNGDGYANTGGVSYPDGSIVEGTPSVGPEEDAEDTIMDGLDGSGVRSYKRILNIQPTADYVTSEAAIKALLNNYSVQIVSMTSTQFNGSIEDINSKYDMVFLGSSAGRLNYSGGNTVFNNTALAGSIYFKDGDSIYRNNGSINMTTYTGNDITTQKKTELLSFLNAGYPIVLDLALYNLTNVKPDTNIHSFISTVKASSHRNFLSLANLNSSNLSTKLQNRVFLTAALNVRRPLIDLLQPIPSEGALLSYTYETDDTLQIQFKLIPKGSIPSIYTYNVHLYIDEDSNGIFDDTELEVVSSDGSDWRNISENTNKVYTFNYDLSGFNGVYQWMLMIERTDNTNVHSIVTGYTAHTNRQNINVLQIRDTASPLNLENKANDTASLIYQYAGTDKLTDYNIIFDTVSVQEFEQLYADEPYTSATASQTGKLTGYHILILDNPVTAISNANGAIDNIKDEAGDNLNIIFTKGALGYGSQSAFYPVGKSGFLSGSTYNDINRYALTAYNSTNQYYNYNSLGVNGALNLDSTYTTKYLTKANEGTISRYPYQINNAIKVSDNSYSGNVTIDYSLSLNQKLVGWYCLSDTKSPVVRRADSTIVGTDAELYHGIYSSSPNDVKNNYYLFSYGGCYYSAIRLQTADVTGNDNEIKLFVNTIITCYKAGRRTVSSPAVITITDPVPVVAADFTRSIAITPGDISGTDFYLTFGISKSSSNMDLTVLLDGIEPSGSWNDTVYEVVSGVPGGGVDINNTGKVISNRTYALAIPVTALTGSHILSLKVTNAEGNITTERVTLIYNQLPVVSILDPVPMTNAANAYLYADIDFNALNADEDYLDAAESLRVVFKVENSLTNFALTVASSGEDLMDGTGYDVTIYPYSDDMGTELVSFTALPQGEYVMYLPPALMKDLSSRKITITATDLYGFSGDASVTLLRRSLFPLD